MKLLRNDPLSALVEAARTDLPSAAQLKALGVELGQAASASAAAGVSLGSVFGSTAAAVKVVGIACTLGAVTVGVTHQERLKGLLSDSQVRSAVAPSFQEGELSVRGSVQQTAALKAEAPQGEPVTRPAWTPELERREVAPRSHLRASKSNEETARSDPLAGSGTVTVTDTDTPRGPSGGNQGLKDQTVLQLSEIQLIELAHQALAKDPARALALSQQHEQHFSHGRLNVERRVLAIKALFQLGRTEAAQRALESFSASYPGSVHLPHLRHLLAPNADKIGTSEH